MTFQDNDPNRPGYQRPLSERDDASGGIAAIALGIVFAVILVLAVLTPRSDTPSSPQRQTSVEQSGGGNAVRPSAPQPAPAPSTSK